MSSKNANARTGSPDSDGDFSVEDAHRSGRPSKIDDEMKALVQANKHLMVRKLATTLKVSVFMTI